MPFVNLKLSAPEPSLFQDISEFLTRSISKGMRKSAEVTTIIIEPVPPDQWFVNSEGLRTRAGFYLHIKITKHTVSQKEMQSFSLEVYQYFKALLPDLVEASYIHIEEVDGTNFGYGGKTQFNRRSVL